MNEKILSEGLQLDRLHGIIERIRHPINWDPVDHLWINNMIDSRKYKELNYLKTDVTDAELNAQISIANAKIEVNKLLKETLKGNL
jgi:ethanolamine utilization cobalamin adenosyltransferase